LEKSESKNVEDWSPDGRFIFEPFDELDAGFSPDGRWLAYQSRESGHDEVYVHPFPDITSGRWQILSMVEEFLYGLETGVSFSIMLLLAK
jgi:hypothetical protein